MCKRFPFCCQALQAAVAADMVLIDDDRTLNWFIGEREPDGSQRVRTVSQCPFCNATEDSVTGVAHDSPAPPENAGAPTTT